MSTLAIGGSPAAARAPAPPPSRPTSWPEPLAGEALHSLPGDIVRAIEPHSEADPAGLLLQLLVAFGSVVDRRPHFVAEADRHGTNLFAVLVGETAKGRKGTSLGHVRRLFREVDPDWEARRVQSGLSSGEGLIWAVRDAIEKREPVRGKGGGISGYKAVVADEGVADKRLLAVEGEFASLLRTLGREGNTLSAVVRNAWDSGDLQSMTKHSPARATGAHVSIVGHVTRDEVLRYLDRTEAANGFGNRFLWACVRRSKVLPEGGRLTDEALRPLADRLRRAVAFARGAGRLECDEEARRIWREVYPDLSEGKPGLLGAMIGRAEAQVMRLAMVYALFDRCGEIRKEHLLAALAVWEYEASARHVFGESLGDPPWPMSCCAP